MQAAIIILHGQVEDGDGSSAHRASALQEDNSLKRREEGQFQNQPGSITEFTSWGSVAQRDDLYVVLQEAAYQEETISNQAESLGSGEGPDAQTVGGEWGALAAVSHGVTVQIGCQ